MGDTKDFLDHEQIPAEHYSAVMKCVNNNLMCGMPHGNFEPFREITLAQVCKIMTYSLNYMREPVLGVTRSDDSPSLERGHWAEAYIQYCRSLGIYPFKAQDTLPDKRLTVCDAKQIANCLYDYLLKTYCIEHHIDLSSIPLDNPPDKELTRSETCLIFVDIFCSFWHSVLYTCASGKDGQDFNDYIQTLLAENDIFPFFSEDTRYFIDCLTSHPTSKKIPLEHFLAIFKLQNLKVTLFCKNLPYTVFHFTNIRALASLSKTSCKLRLTNSAFLNDPSEGIVARNQLKTYIESHTGYNCTSLINRFLDSNSDAIPVSNTYIASFNLNLGQTSLPMWYQYGDEGAGCSIEFATNEFSAPIYKVFYLPDDISFFNSFMDDVFSIISNALNGAASCDNSFFEHFVHSFLHQITFLFKDSCYSHEKEIRAIISCEPRNANIEPEPRPGEFFPRTYCETTYQIVSVTFGPKVHNVDQLVVGCVSQGLNCKFHRSTLPFQ